jgi:hypothetical protein
VEATVKAIYLDGKFVNSVPAGSDALFGVLLDKTNFYAEQGGQTFDVGQLTIDGKMDFMVENVQVFAGYVLHVGYLKYGAMAVGDTVTASYDEVGRVIAAVESSDPNGLTRNLSSCAGGRSGITTPRRISSTLHCGRSSGIRSTKRGRLWTTRSCGLIFPTR